MYLRVWVKQAVEVGVTVIRFAGGFVDDVLLLSRNIVWVERRFSFRKKYQVKFPPKGRFLYSLLF